MRTTIIFITFTLLLSTVLIVNANATPKCKFQGTRSEGWYNEDKLIKYDICDRKILECLYNNTRSEGWYSAEVLGDKMLVDYSFCSTESFKPTCRYPGTRSEGWYLNETPIIFDHCESRHIGCFYPGSRSEGWYTYEKSRPDLIMYDVDCALY